MKTIIIVFAISFVAVLAEITDEQRAKLRAYKESCIVESGVNPTLVEKARNGEIVEGDEKFACFATCMLKKVGIINADGTINLEVARAKIPQGVSQDQINNLFATCQNITGTGCEKGGKFWKCIVQNKTFPILF